jgi:hypothetical protein
MTLSNVSLDLSAFKDHCTLHSLFLVVDQLTILYCSGAPTQGFASRGRVRGCHPNVKNTEQSVY